MGSTRGLAAAAGAPEPRADRLRRALVDGWPGRLIAAGGAIKVLLLLATWIAGPLPPVLEALDTAAALALAAGGGSFLAKGLAVARRRLLWRVRRKLIISYIFIGVVPALLIGAFFVLGGILLFIHFSSYLVQERLHGLADRARWIAETTAVELPHTDSPDVDLVLERRREAAAGDFAGVSLAVVPADRPCEAAGLPAPPLSLPRAAGPWRHIEPPDRVPAWIGCGGFSGLFAYRDRTATGAGGQVPRDEEVQPFADGPGNTHLLVRAVVWPESARDHAVIVDVPVEGDVQQQLRMATGVELSGVDAATSDGVAPLTGRAAAHSVVENDPSTRVPFPALTFLEYTDWNSGRQGTVRLEIQLRIAEIYRRIAEAPGRIGETSWGVILLSFLGLVGAAFLIIQIVALGAGLALARSITGSVHELAVGTERVRQGDFTHKITVTAEDQLGELAQSFNSMTASIEDLLREAAEKKRLEEELRIAHEIQMSLLPQGPLRMPGLSVTAACVPAREVGGDYYDFLPLGGRRLGMLIADVSGKGTSAALYMAELKGLILSLSRTHTSPRDLLIEANRIIAEHLDARSFITMTFAVVDLDAGTMTYARAGHTPLIYLPGGGPDRAVKVLTPDGLVLGLNLDGGRTFERLLEEETLPLHPGDVYLLFTDGISEAMNEADDLFGEQRLARLVEEHAGLPPDGMRELVLAEISTFVGGAPQHDDMTFILLKIEDPISRPAAATPLEAVATPL
jgi:serine phosphatase RsbU (regulator of sigma subunit)